MYKELYQKAYGKIRPQAGYVERIQEGIRKKGRRQIKGTFWVAVAATVVLLMVTGTASVSVLAKEYPAIYRIVARYAPAISECIVQEKRSCSEQGIQMQLEAVHVDGTQAEVIVSFADEAGSNWIKGEVDLYDSYELYGGKKADLVMGGCRFLEYDPAEDKAYVQIVIQSDAPYVGEMAIFSVNMLLCNEIHYQETINLAEINQMPQTEDRVMNGWGGDWEALHQQMQTRELAERTVKWEKAVQEAGQGAVLEAGQWNEVMVPVLKHEEGAELLADALTVTGVAHQDGILRVQICRGDVTEADRYMLPVLVNQTGEEWHEDYSWGWQERVDGTPYTFEEFWFFVEEEELSASELKGDVCVKDGAIRGNWNIAFPMEEQ
ncbi:MAG: DUF4179 domain-containing protein [Lachnospiraceae bacterium]|nr:DUF4179 domain-containing protein [Lachnospiraceae bacterium]